jgi:predicted nucleic-acid-binding Zn-ribbon protein
MTAWMRTSHRCPKCHYDEILHVPEPTDTDLDRMAIGGRSGVLAPRTNGALESYTCLRCGFSEFYVREPHAIDIEKIRGATLLRAAAEEPYR